ncbi:hypothetical protein HMPREF9999_01223 [Alloprevotella sp. oral taxon 473 str. F0040]|nr:hypothetical protein HMPREF9999_01223 [Alloprevotella sp. oral taxon 473 str. F0040]
MWRILHFERSTKPNRSLERYSAIRYREDNFLPSSIFLLSILFLVRSRRSSLRLRTHNQPAAQQSNEIRSESNDRLGLNDICMENTALYQSNGSD